MSTFNKEHLRGIERPERGYIPETFTLSHLETIDGKNKTFSYVVKLEIDYNYDFTEFRGEFTDKWEEGCIQLHDGSDWHNWRYFMPEYTIEERRKDLNKQGYSKGVADYLARKNVYDDMRIARDPDAADVVAVIVEVQAWLHGVELGLVFHGGIEYTMDSVKYLDYIICDQLNEARREALNNLKRLTDTK